MNTPERPAPAEASIRDLVDSLAQGIRDKDVDRVMSVFTPDVVSFDLGPPLRHGGGEEFRKRWLELFEAVPGAIEYEIHDLRITTGEAVAFSYSLNRTGWTSPNGGKSSRWIRWTACYRRMNGRWLIVHEQVSVPVDVRSGQAALDLTP